MKEILFPFKLISIKLKLIHGDNVDLPYGLTMRGIVKNKNGEILLVKRHHKSRTDPEKWELPGGKVEPNESFDKAIVREIKEETNLDCKVGDFCEAIQRDYTHKRSVQMIMYLKDIEGEVKISDEHEDWRWVDLKEIPEFDISYSLKKVLEKRNYKI